MKVAMIVPGGVDRSGEERVIPCLLWMIERLARRHDLHVFALNQESRPCRYELLGAQVHNAGARPRRLRLAGQVLREHRKGRFDILHAIWSAPQGVIAAGLGAILGVPVLLRLTGGDLCALPDIGYGQRNSWRGRAWLRAAVRGAAHVTAPSQALLDSAAALGITAERLPWGVATDRWKPSSPRPRDLDRPARLLFVGSLNRVKDVATCIESAAVLQARNTPFLLDVIGEDFLGGAAERLAREKGLADKILFHGFLRQSRLRPFMEIADALVVSSRHEADPIVALEAAAAGTPVVGTHVGLLREWAPEAALTVPPGDARALADGIEQLLSDDERRLAIARRAQARALAEDADWSATRVNEIYERLARTHRSFEH
jgi:glycosyltransferase involved in cell wall biosynthesis